MSELQQFRVTFDLWARSEDDAKRLVAGIANAASQRDAPKGYDNFSTSLYEGNRFVVGHGWMTAEGDE